MNFLGHVNRVFYCKEMLNFLDTWLFFFQRNWPQILEGKWWTILSFDMLLTARLKQRVKLHLIWTCVLEIYILWSRSLSYRLFCIIYCWILVELNIFNAVWREFVWGALAGAFGEGMMHPIDTLKTRVQSQAVITGTQVLDFFLEPFYFTILSMWLARTCLWKWCCCFSG